VEDRAIARDALTRNASAVRRLCAGFLAAKQLVGADLVSAPAVEILLELYIAEVEGRCLSGDEIAAAIQLSVANTLRWLRILAGRALIEVERGEPIAADARFRVARRCELALEGLIARSAI
jgi:hypothetical protein